ncbi:DUF3048 domain-containing protein [Patescibacteria group bacterium]|nr:DUF3048 domain-containing protein [Patescibacteria group bacterium]
MNKIFKGLILFVLLILLSACQSNDQAVVIAPESIDIITKESSSKELDDFVLQENQGLSVAIMVDNFKDSRPLSGISDAKIVYEAPVEGGITRLLMLFQFNSLPDKIGPVRSARPYFIDWADEYEALFIHAGGSPIALANIKQDIYSIYDLNEISSNGNYFWRDWQRQEPHNLYISANSIENFVVNENIDKEIKQEFMSWKFNDNLQPDSVNEDFFYDSNDATYALRIDYKEPVVWEFNNDIGGYLRYQNNDIFLSDSDEQIVVKNIVVQKTDMVVFDEIGRKRIKTVGSGDAVVFQHNNIIQATWKKEKDLDRTRFYNKKSQEEIEFAPGLIWIEIVSNNHELMY